MPHPYSRLRRAPSITSPLPSSTPMSSIVSQLSPSNPPRQSHPPIVHSPPPPQPRLFDIFFVVDPSAPRKAPQPPKYRHRRKRSRHMKFKDPARSGLFTLVEVTDEEEEGLGDIPSVCSSPAPSAIERTPSAVPSSACFPCPSPRVELGSPVGFADMADDEMEEIALGDEPVEDTVETAANVKKWRLDLPPRPTLLSAATIQHLSPPFGLEEELAPLPAKTSHRPLPLKLTHKRRPLSWYKHHPFAARPSRETRPPSEPSLLSPSPIASLGVYRARQRSGSAPSPDDKVDNASVSPDEIRAFKSSPVSDGPSRCSSSDSDVNLEHVLEELLAQCGEISPRFRKYYSIDWVAWIGKGLRDQTGSSGESSDSDLDCDMSSFPLPPARELLSPITLSPALYTPSTPPPHTNPFDASLDIPSTPRRDRDSDGWVPKLHGDHSFLQAMSRGDDVSASPASSTVLLSPGSSLRSSTSSDRSSKLPVRKGLPEMWRV